MSEFVMVKRELLEVFDRENSPPPKWAVEELRAALAQEAGKDDAAARRCQSCNSPRTGETCHKCGAKTIKKHPKWDEQKLPPVDRIRALAKEVGYAIGEHGTKERDLDLIAAPWSEAAVGHKELMEHIAMGIGAIIIDIEAKPLGRYACTLQLNGWFKPVDLSVCPSSLPALVSMILPDRKYSEGLLAIDPKRQLNDEWNACLDKVKDLNQ